MEVTLNKVLWGVLVASPLREEKNLVLLGITSEEQKTHTHTKYDANGTCRFVVGAVVCEQRERERAHENRLNWRTKARHNTSKLLFRLYVVANFSISTEYAIKINSLQDFSTSLQRAKYAQTKPWMMMMWRLLLPLLSIHTNSFTVERARARVWFFFSSVIVSFQYDVVLSVCFVCFLHARAKYLPKITGILAVLRAHIRIWMQTNIQMDKASLKTASWRCNQKLNETSNQFVFFCTENGRPYSLPLEARTMDFTNVTCLAGAILTPSPTPPITSYRTVAELFAHAHHPHCNSAAENACC